MAIAGNTPSFVDGDDAATISVSADHPAKKFLIDASIALDRQHIRVAVECLQEAMTAIAVHDGHMVEF